ncbi:UV excision repair protein rad23 [Cyanidiococcus yangmingshanensis]|uniref:UV excision repair protein RAD23 n=1 Tax=Cyanidiococcus yangmingshanensis TaxID=2690220 RepID=A0A7J7III9_9RHOD|nr:UV excision repair protein rad23 [Cyanidiococcus yangmingshanensis]
MRLSFRTLDNKQFSIEEINPDLTVDELKRTLGKREELCWDQSRCHEARLIFAGRVLSESSQTLADCGVQDNDFLVIMPPRVTSSRVRKTEVASNAITNLTEPGEAKQATTSQGINSPGVAPTMTADSQGEPFQQANKGEIYAPESFESHRAPQAKQENPSNIASSGLVTGEEYSLCISRMRDMGFDDDSIEKAMRAAHHNPERAIEYLCSGLPDSVGDSPRLSGDSSAVSDDGSFHRRGTQQTGPNREAEVPQHEAQTIRGDLEILRRLPHFALLRRAIQQDPSQIQALLAELQRIDPRLLDIIQRNQAEFISMLNEPVSDEEAERELRQLQELVSHRGRDENRIGGTTLPAESAQAVRVEVTQEEADQLRQLEEMMEPMGVSRETCLQIWLGCDRNIELAAMHIMDNLGDYTSNSVPQSDDDEDNAQEP